MRNEIEVFESLNDRARIEGIDINDLRQLLLAPGPTCSKSYKNYNVKMADLNLLLLYDKNKNTNILLKCVNKYYNVEEKECYRIRRELGTYNDSQEQDACIKCHLECMNKVKNKQLLKL